MAGKAKKPDSVTTKRVADLLRAGVPLTSAVAIAGIHYSTHYRWLMHAENAKSNDDPHVTYRATLEAAKASVVSSLSQKAKKKAEDDGDPDQFRALQFLLKSYDRETFGDSSKVDMSGKLAVTVDTDLMSSDDIEKRIAQLTTQLKAQESDDEEA